MIARASIFLFSLLFLLPISASAQEQDCPEGYKCIPNEKAEDIREIIEHRKCMEKAIDGENEKLQFKMDPYTIVVTKKGQVFSKDNIKSHLRWCNWNLSFETDPNLTVQIREKTKSSGWKFEFRPRVRLGAIFHPADIGSKRFRNLFEPSLLFEPLHFGPLHPETQIGIQSFGLGGGVDITRNMDVYVGAASKWKDPFPILPVAGISLSFN